MLDLLKDHNIIFTQAVSINCDMRRDKLKINNVEDVVNVRWLAAISTRSKGEAEKLQTNWYYW